MEFEWDEGKARANLKKHGISFDEAIEAFKDPYILTFQDERKNYGEPRYICLAEIEMRIHALVFTLRESSIRMISARKANLRERKQYADSQTHH